MDIITLIGFGIADALNPFSIGAMIYLLATDRPIARGLVFIMGTLFVYFPGGFALMTGWAAVINMLLPIITPWLPAVLHFVLGLICCVAAIYFFRRKRKEGKQTDPKPHSLSLTATFIFAIASTLSDLPTAIPYFAAVNIITGLGHTLFFQLCLLMLYNLVYVSPLILVLVIAMFTGAKAQPALKKVRTSIDWCLVHLLPPTIGWLGIYLIAQGIRMLG
jgi:cytochrome c biogenesis protein CcdA